MFLNKVRNDFGIGFGCKFVPFFSQLSLQGQVILDDAVMRDNDTSLAIAVRMRVFFGRTPVGRPTRMAETELPRDRLLCEQLFEIFQLARAAADLQLLVLNDSDTGGVVTPVLEGSQAAHDDRDRITRPDVAENSTHAQSEYHGAKRIARSIPNGIRDASRSLLLFSGVDPALFVDLAAAGDGEGISRNIVGD